MKYSYDPSLEGALEDHSAKCGHCDGDVCEDACQLCEGGEIGWGSWYHKDFSECDWCQKEKPVGRMFEPQYMGGPEYICFVCYVGVHKNECGCELFAWAEEKESNVKESDKASPLQTTQGARAP